MASASLLGLPRICPSITTMVSAEMMISSSAQSFATALAFSALTRATSCSGGSVLSIVDVRRMYGKFQPQKLQKLLPPGRFGC